MPAEHQDEQRIESSPSPSPTAETAPPPVDEERPPKKHSLLRELPVLIVVAFVVALLIKTFALQAFYIPSESMEPTLETGDRVLVEKITYRLSRPDRGDVVVFERDLVLPGAPEEDDSLWETVVDSLRGLFGFPTGTEQDFIKRVMAVGGDKIEGRDGRVYVNDEIVDEPFLSEGEQTSPFGPIEIPRGKIFVMGDNRNNSDDSRNFGPIEADKVVGHAFLLIWPPQDFDTL